MVSAKKIYNENKKKQLFMTFVQNQAAGKKKKKENKLQNFIPVCPKTPKQELCQKPFTHFLAAVTSNKYLIGLLA